MLYKERTITIFLKFIYLLSTLKKLL